MNKECTHELEVFSKCPLCKIKQLEDERTEWKLKYIAISEKKDLLEESASESDKAVLALMEVNEQLEKNLEEQDEIIIELTQSIYLAIEWLDKKPSMALTAKSILQKALEGK